MAQSRTQAVKALAAECGFDLAGVTPAISHRDFARYRQWVDAGMGGAMGYLSDRRAELRREPNSLLTSAKSIVCVGKVYNAPLPSNAGTCENGRGWVSRYAWGSDYHDLMRTGLEKLVGRMRQEFGEFEWKICVDTAPLLERSYAREAGLGWIGKNTCLINQQLGSWMFLGEVLVSLDLEPDGPPPDRCGTCTRCIDACPTVAIVPRPEGGFTLDSRRCISYFTIELKGEVPEEHRPGIGNHVFGCDICQDVCPWNRRAAVTEEPEFQPAEAAPDLMDLAALSQESFNQRFRNSPVKRTKHSGFLRNVAVAMGNSGDVRFREPLVRMAAASDAVVAEHARWALAQLE